MNELKAWEYLKDRWTNHIIKTTLGCSSNIYNHYEALGLCNSIIILWCFNEITEEIKTSMIRKIPLDRPYSGYVWHKDINGAKNRADFCKKQIALLSGIV